MPKIKKSPSLTNNQLKNKLTRIAPAKVRKLKPKNQLNIGILTGGGDCPGLNSAIAGFVQTLTPKNKVFGFMRSFNGLIENQFQILDKTSVDDIQHLGGTFLKSAKSYPLHEKNAIAKIKKNQLDALCIIGGDSTLSVASKLQEKIKIPTVGIPKTIDNDIAHNDFSIGFITAVQTATENIEQLKSTAKSHSRAIVVEIMGRHAGWLCAYAGLASACDFVLTPEYPTKLEKLKKEIIKRKKTNKKHLLIAVAEGAVFINEKNKKVNISQKNTKSHGAKVRYGGVASWLSNWMNEFIDWDARHVNLGHLQRGGTPVAMDRVLSYALGNKAAQLILDKNFGQVATFKNGEVTSVPFNSIEDAQKMLSDSFFKLILNSTQQQNII